MPNRWAIITGASSGIGKALALEFAAAGWNVFLTGRNEVALNDVAAACSSQYQVQTEVFAADLGSAEGIARLIAQIEWKAHGYEALVNNAGFGIHGDFASTDVAENVELVNVQLTALLRLTRAVLPGMITRRSGKILNVASVYSFSPVPFQSVYAACKAFMLSFSASLQNELAGTGITVTVFCPEITQTAFRSRAGIGEKRTDSGMTAAETARIGFREMMQGKHVVVPGWVNRAFVFVSRILPVQASTTLVRFVNRRRGQ